MNEAVFSAQANYAIEEPVNYYLNRPLASFFVDFFFKFTKVTPNQVTFLAMVVGVLAGLQLTGGSRNAFFGGALLFLLSQVLDCADGQLARLKNMSSPFGRILDGAGDYVVGLAIFGGIFYSLWSRYEEIQLITVFPIDRPALALLLVLCLLSSIVHSASYDYIKTKFASILKTGVDDTEKEKQDYLRKIQLQGASEGHRSTFLLKTYKLYTGLQQRLFSLTRFSKIHYTLEEREALFARYRTFLRFWSWSGPNSHYLFIVLAALLGDMVLAVLMIVFPMNLYYLFLLVYTRIKLR